MKPLSKLLFFLFLLIAYSLPLKVSYADIPHLINYQGKLTDKTNKPIEGTQTITFRIYDAETAGNLLWEETQSVTMQRGIFSVMLGGVTALNLAFDKSYWLEIKVGSEAMTPRQRMASVGYAFTAGNVAVSSMNKGTDASAATFWRGDGVWAKPTFDYILLQDQKPQGSRGDIFSVGQWVTRTVNIEVTDSGNICSLSSNHITLAPGTYTCDITAAAWNCRGHQVRLQNITDGVTTLIGAQGKGNLAGGDGQIDSILKGRFVISSQKIFEIQHYGSVTDSEASFDRGGADGAPANIPGSPEIYLQAVFIRVSQ